MLLLAGGVPYRRGSPLPDVAIMANIVERKAIENVFAGIFSACPP